MFVFIEGSLGLGGDIPGQLAATKDMLKVGSIGSVYTILLTAITRR